jgi:hypothetical protein
MESLVSDIPAGDGKTANLFLYSERVGKGAYGAEKELLNVGTGKEWNVRCMQERQEEFRV